MGKTCQICGANSGIYPLCKIHLEMKSQNKVIKNEESGKWELVNEKPNNTPIIADWLKTPANIIRRITDTLNTYIGKCECLICEEETNNNPLCKDCYDEIIEYMDQFDKNMNTFEINDYYFNLRNNIKRMKDFEIIQSNCNKLLALAISNEIYHNNQSLSDRVIKDITDIIKIKKPKPEEKVIITETIIRNDSRKEEVFRTTDGHYVKSNPEMIIDDILYNCRIVHCYEKKVPIKTSDKALSADWFIPITDLRHGIYIEYWGMNTKDYLENKARKQAQYKENDIPLIEIEKDDYKDIQGLTDRIISEINELAFKHFNIKNYLK